MWVHIDRHTTVRHHTCTQYSDTTYLSLRILRVTMQCKGVSTYAQHKVPVAVLLCALTPLGGGYVPPAILHICM